MAAPYVCRKPGLALIAKHIRESTAMPLNAIEQYLLELINRGRLDPAAEAARYGVALNAGLAAGTIDASAKQVLAPNAQLETAATGHSSWMLAHDIFDHTETNGSTPGNRATQQGYIWGMVGENIALLGTSASTIDLADAIEGHHAGLYRSEHHRTNTMNEDYREIGLSQEQGDFTFQGQGTYTASMLTELFGRSGNTHFLTGVAYTDRDADKFYSIGEGRGDLQLRAGGIIGQSSAAGGYAMELDPARNLAVTGTIGDRSFGLTVDLSQGNVKLDVVGLDLLLTSGSVDLDYGIHDVRLLGVDDLDASGTASANRLSGNKGDNLLTGLAGNDSLSGGSGADRLNGGADNDLLIGGTGNDRLTASAGYDRMWGGAGADDFVFSGNFSREVIRDFSVQGGDDLLLNNSLWTGQLTAAQVVARFADVVRGDVLFDFGHGETILLDGVGSLTGLAATISIF
jgi:serralysin